MTWYYAENNERKGPLNDGEFESLVREGKIAPAMLVWNETMTAWLPFREVKFELPPQFEEPEEPAEPTPQERSLEQSLERNGPWWEDRAEIGTVNAAVETVKQIIGDPDTTYARMKRTGGWRTPLGYALLVGGAGSFVGFLYNTMLERLMGIAPKGSEVMLASNTGFVLQLMSAALFIPVFIAGSAFVNAAIIHFALTVFGVAKQPFETTWRVVCYSLGSTAVFQFLPVLGGLIALVWNMISMTIGIAEAHEIPRFHAALAIAPVILFTLAGFVVMLRSFF